MNDPSLRLATEAPLLPCRRPGRMPVGSRAALCFGIALALAVGTGEATRAQDAERPEGAVRVRVRSLATPRTSGTGPFGTGRSTGAVRTAGPVRGTGSDRSKGMWYGTVQSSSGGANTSPGSVSLAHPVEGPNGPPESDVVRATPPRFAAAPAQASAGSTGPRARDTAPGITLPSSDDWAPPVVRTSSTSGDASAPAIEVFRPFEDEDPLRESSFHPARPGIAVGVRDMRRPELPVAPSAVQPAPVDIVREDRTVVPATADPGFAPPNPGPAVVPAVPVVPESRVPFDPDAIAPGPTPPLSASDEEPGVAGVAGAVAGTSSVAEPQSGRAAVVEPDGFEVESLFDDSGPGAGPIAGAPEAPLVEDEVLRPVPEKLDYRKEIPEDMLERILFQGEPAPLVDPPKPEGATDENDPARRGGGTRGTPETLGSPPPDFSLLFLRQQTIFLQPGQTAVDFGFRYAWREFRFPTVLGGGFVANARTRTRQLTVPFAARYGANERTQLFASLPVGMAHLESADPLSDDTTTLFGTGDLFLGFNYLLKKGHGDLPDIVGTLAVNVPLGADPWEFSPGPAALGSGFWGAQASLLATKSYDPVVVFWGFGYGHEFDRNFLGVSLDPGELFFYQFGAGFAVNDSMVLSTQFFGGYRSNLKANGYSISNSGQEPMSLRFALTYTENRCQIVEPFVRIGLTPDVPEVDLGVTWTRRF